MSLDRLENPKDDNVNLYSKWAFTGKVSNEYTLSLHIGDININTLVDLVKYKMKTVSRVCKTLSNQMSERLIEYFVYYQI